MGKVILLVEDDEDVLVALKQRLEQEGYRVDTARDGREVLSILAGNRRYDMIVSGLNMPVMNGLELLKRVRHDDREVPFILVSAGASEERIAEALRMGATRFSPKPLAIKELMAAIAKSCT